MSLIFRVLILSKFMCLMKNSGGLFFYSWLIAVLEFYL